jgi:tetratricopeptide (TPR) repeat protein
MATLTLDIRPGAGSPPAGWQGTWAVDGQPVGDPIPPAAAADAALAAAGRRFLGRFEHRGARPLVDPDDLRADGRLLHDRWFAPAWDSLKTRLGPGPHELLVRSPDPAVLNWPWELVELFPPLAVGCDAGWSLRRTPLDALSPDAPLAPGPLKVLFLAAAPTDQPQLDYEREEDAMLRATARIPEQVAVLFAETGGIDELADLVTEHQPHVVHLSGHGVVTKDGTGTFAFEDERGLTDGRRADEIVAKVFRGSPARCVFLNGCRTSQAATAGLAQALVKAGVPLVVGWSASVADDRATDFAEVFYGKLVRGESVPAAAAHARHAIQAKGRVREGQREVQDATFALPQVYCSAAGSGVYDRSAPPVPLKAPQVRPTLLEDGIKGLREGFVGRRRDIQKLVPALRHGDATFAVLTGLGGAGKSTLATKAANRLRADGFRAYGVRAEGKQAKAVGRQTLSKLIDAMGRAFAAAGRQDLYDQLTSDKLSAETRLHVAVDGLKQIKAVFVLDNFEDAMALKPREIADPALAEFYAYLARHLTEGSRVIVTCRYLPDGTPAEAEQSTVRHFPLGDFQAHDFKKFLRRDPVVDARLRAGVLTEALTAELFQRVGGTPRFLDQVRTVLRTIDPSDLQDELNGVAAGKLGEMREAYYEKIFVSRLYAALPAAARKLVSQLAVSELPLPLDAVALVAGKDETAVAGHLIEAVSFGLLQQFAESNLPTLHHPPGLLRPWLADPVRLPQAEVPRVHAVLAAFWKSAYEAAREADLRVPIDEELRACRAHAKVAGTAADVHQWATLRLAKRHFSRVEWQASRELLEEIPDAERTAEVLRALARVESDLGEWKLSRLHQQQAIDLGGDDRHAQACDLHSLATVDLNEGDYPAAREKGGRAKKIMQAIGDRAGEAATWHQLATIDLREGDYRAAREKFGRAKEITQAIGDRAGEAGTWHQLATVDLKEGDYPAAREKFGRAQKITQAIGDRAGEAATWQRLGDLASRTGRSDHGARMVALCWLIDKSIGHGETNQDFNSLLGCCQELGFGEEQIKQTIDEAIAAYQLDRGRTMLLEAFPELATVFSPPTG